MIKVLIIIFMIVAIFMYLIILGANKNNRITKVTQVNKLGNR